MSKPSPESIAKLLEYLSGGPGHKHRRLIIEHKAWCPLLQRKGPCVCNPVSHEASDEEWERLTSLPIIDEDEFDKATRQEKTAYPGSSLSIQTTHPEDSKRTDSIT